MEKNKHLDMIVEVRLTLVKILKMFLITILRKKIKFYFYNSIISVKPLNYETKVKII